VCLGLDSEYVVSSLRVASKPADTCETWRILRTPLEDLTADSSTPSVEQAQKAREAAKDAQGALESVAEYRTDASPSEVSLEADFAELHLACRFAGLFAEKVAIAHGLGGSGVASEGVSPNRNDWADGLLDAGEKFASRWNHRNKPSGLVDIQDALREAAEDMRRSLR
jgi:hypothetical protein